MIWKKRPVETQISNLDNGKVNTSDVVNALDSTETTKPLSAAQGKVLNDSITTINNKIGTVPTGETVEGQITSLNSNIANLEPVSIIDKLFITNTNFELYSESSIYLVSHLVVMNIYLHVKNSVTLQAGGIVIGGIANGYRPAYTIRVPANIDGLNKQGSFDVKAIGDISLGISENMSFTSNCYIRIPSIVYKLN